MWLSKMISLGTIEEKPESGSITISANHTLEADSSIRVRALSSYSPYGYSAVPPVGEEVMLLPAADGQAIIGTRLRATELDSGEICITSRGGASITLKNDGSVIINSLKINKDGVIEQ